MTNSPNYDNILANCYKFHLHRIYCGGWAAMHEHWHIANDWTAVSHGSHLSVKFWVGLGKTRVDPFKVRFGTRAHTGIRRVWIVFVHHLLKRVRLGLHFSNWCTSSRGAYSTYQRLRSNILPVSKTLPRPGLKQLRRETLERSRHLRFNLWKALPGAYPSLKYRVTQVSPPVNLRSVSKQNDSCNRSIWCRNDKGSEML